MKQKTLAIVEKNLNALFYQCFDKKNKPLYPMPVLEALLEMSDTIITLKKYAELKNKKTTAAEDLRPKSDLMKRLLTRLSIPRIMDLEEMIGNEE